MPLSIRIDLADDSAAPVVTVTASKAIAGKRKASVSFALNFDPSKPTAQPKRRDGESDEAYAARCSTYHPHTVDVPPEFAEGLTERLREILDAVRDVGEHYADRAAAEQLLAAVGKAMPGVKSIKVGGSLSPKSNLKTGG